MNQVNNSWVYHISIIWWYTWHTVFKLYRIMATPENKTIIIEGITAQGKAFRPSDWAERVSGSLASFKEVDFKGKVPFLYILVMIILFVAIAANPEKA